ncbi:MAG: heme exporter protein CcmB [Candidatus Binatia bacterium]
MRGALAILRKDLRIEWRTKESLSSFVVLGVLLLVVFSVAHDPTPEEAPRLAPAVLWATFVFTGLLGIQRAFLLEREQDCLAGLLLAPIDPAAIYAGKLAATVILLAVLQAIVVPLVGLLLHVDLGPALPGLAVVLVLGNVGFAALATLFAAIAVRVRAREVMLPLLLLPLLIPVLVGGVKATVAVLAGGLAEAREAITVLAAFDVIFTVAGWLLFPLVVRD